MPPGRVEIAIGYLRVGARLAVVLVFHRLQSRLCPGRIPTPADHLESIRCLKRYIARKIY
jgi:hypothetical protein